MTLLKTYSLNGASAGTALTSGNTGFVSITDTGSLGTYVARGVYGSGLSCEFASSASVGSFGEDQTTGEFCAFYFYLPTAPTGDETIAITLNGSTTLAAIGIISTGAVRVYSSLGTTVATTTATLSTSTWYRIEWQVNASGQEMRLYTAAGGTAIETKSGLAVASALAANKRRFGHPQGAKALGVVDMDQITIHDAWPALGNVAPTAAFIHSESGLGTSVDAASSTDTPDGIAAYDWDWGDGTAHGTTPTASHTYTFSGTYTVTLTVTDTFGATGSTSHTATVSGGSSSEPMYIAPVDHFRVVHNYTGKSWQDFTGSLVGVQVNLREWEGKHTASLSFYRAAMDPSQSSGTRVIKKGDLVRLSAKNGSGKRRKMALMKVGRVNVAIDLRKPVGRQNLVTIHLHGAAGVAGTGSSGSSGVGSIEELSNIITSAPFSIDADANTYAWVGTAGNSASTLTTPEGVVRTNLCGNGSFERGTTGWTANNATLAQSTDWSDDGGYSLKVTPTGASNDSSAEMNISGLTSGATYTISGTIRLTAPLTATLEARAFGLNVYDGTTQTNAFAVNDEGETRVTATIVMGSTGLRVRLYNGSIHTGESVWWDSITVEKTSTDKGYFDGDSSGYDGAGITAATDGTVLRTNLVENPSFETNTTGWAALSNCTISRSTTVGGFAGAAALRLSSTTSGTMSAVVSGTGNMAAAVAGSSYDASVYVRSAVSARSASMFVIWYTSGGASISTTTVATATTTTGGFTRLSAVGLVAPATTAFAAVGVSIASTGGASELHYADAFLFEGSDGTVTARDYFDGDTTDTDTREYGWTGTAGGSSSSQSMTWTEVASINTASEFDQVMLTRDSSPGVIVHEDPSGTVVAFNSATKRTGSARLAVDATNYASIAQRFDMSHIINVLRIKYLEKVRVDKKHTRVIEHDHVYEDAASIAKYGRFSKKIKVHKKQDFAAHASDVFARNADPENVPASVTIPILQPSDLLGGYEDGHYVGNKVNVTLPDGVTVYTCRIHRIQHHITPSRWTVQLFLRDQNIHHHVPTHHAISAATNTDVGNNPDGAVLGSHLTDDIDGTGKVATGMTFQNTVGLADGAGVEGFRFEDDTAGGVLKFWTGTPNETGAGWINPAVIGTIPLDVPGVEIASPDTATAARSFLRLYTGGAEYRSSLHEFYGLAEFQNDINVFGAIFGSGAVHSAANGFIMDDLNGGGSTTASIGNSGRIIRTPSSRRYKDDIEPMDLATARTVLDLEPVTFRLKSEGEAGRVYPGFIAEQAAEVGAELWVNRDDADRPDGFRYAEVSAALVLLVQEQASRIERLEALVAELAGH